MARATTMRLPLRIRVALLLCACPSAFPFSAQSKHATKYYAMIDRFAEHSRSDIESIESPRFREMLCSVQEAIHDTKVVNAFGILYEDIAPVRFAGDLIFSKLDSAVFKAAESKGSREAPDAALEALRADDLAQVRRAFAAIDADGSGSLDEDELARSGLLRTPGAGAVAQAGAKPAAAGGNPTASARFDDMVATFADWGADATLVARAEARNPRLAQVLDGCFAGARNPSVVNALRVLYEDYRLLRMGGDLIFKLMVRLVGTEK